MPCPAHVATRSDHKPAVERPRECHRERARLLIAILSMLFLSTGRAAPTASDARLEILRQAVAAGTLACRLSEPGEVIVLLGPPEGEEEVRDGGMQRLMHRYAGLEVVYGRMRDGRAPFTLRGVVLAGARLDLGCPARLVLRTEDDLRKLDGFWGLQDVCLVRLDLSDRRGLLDEMGFDTLTEWPPAERLPPGFDPDALLAAGRDPGLGVRALHAEGIDGRGVGLAVIDQPLLLGHEEYAGRLVHYDAAGLAGMPPQMHGPPVASIAVGRTVGVAPGAELSYFAVPMWEQDNAPYVRCLREIVEHHPQVRAVSISAGAFASRDHEADWQAACREAQAAGVLVVTCDPEFLAYGTLARAPGADPDDPESYRPGLYSSAGDVVRVPAGNRTIASHRGDDVYTFDRTGGMSWGAPYIAGLAALACQVDPRIRPERIVRALVETARASAAGPVVDPRAFIARVRASAGAGADSPR